MSSPATSAGHASRLSNFKQGARQVQDLRRKRVEQSIELRKQQRDEQLQKRRALDDETGPMSPSGADADHSLEAPDSPQTLPPMSEMIEAMNSDNRKQQLYGTQCIRKILSNITNPPIETIIQSGCVPRLIQLLSCDDCHDLQFEAAWALTNIASGTTEQTTSVIQYGAIKPLARLMTSPSPRVLEQVIWALGNIAGEGAWARDKVLAAGIMRPLLAAINLSEPDSVTKTAVWALSNLCRNKNPLVDFDAIKPALPTISRLLQCSDGEILADTCWALSYLTDGPDDRIGAVQDALNLSGFVPLLAHPVDKVQTAALRAIGNMVTGTEKQTDKVIEAGFLSILPNLLQSERMAIVKESAWAASNILAGTGKQIQDFINANLLPPLIKVLSCGDVRCQREAAWSVTHLILEGSTSQISSLMEAGGLRPFLTLLSSQDTKIVMIVLDGLLNLLRKADAFGQVNALCVAIEEDGHLDRLEKLQHHDNEDIYKKTINIIDKYFSEEEEAQGQDLAPQETNGEFHFNGGSGHIGGF